MSSFFSNPAAFFMHPWTMLAGAILALTPIIIHLINRMRFRRVKWAAMEFLLKAQKKMRRKKILEQLILLLLRILMVLLVGLLFARFLGWDPMAGKETRPTIHIIILDDSPSMDDLGDGKVPHNTFTEAKRQINERILPATLQATTRQYIRVIRLSDLTDILNTDPNKEVEQINTDVRDRIKAMLGGEKVSDVRVGLAEGMKKAREWLDKSDKDWAKIVHVVTDLRGVDWSQDGEAISQELKHLTEASGAKVHLIDVASPYRKVDLKVPSFSDNVGIVELKPRARVAAKNKAVDFELRVKNYGATDIKDMDVWFYRNGQGNLPTLRIDKLPANQEVTQIVTFDFSQTATKADPLAGFNVLTARLAQTDALAADNVRHAVIEVRDNLRVLVIEGRPELKDDRKGDGFYLRRVFLDSFGGIDWVAADAEGAEALVRQDLRQYSSIYLLNVQQLNDKQVQALEQYVREGGGVGVFLGPKVSPGPYNNLMYRRGEGFFPVPLPDPLPIEQTTPLTEEQKLTRTLSFTKRILLRDPSVRLHPALAGIYTNERGVLDKTNDIERFFFAAFIDHHWPIARRGAWRDDRSVQELYCLPNDRPMKEFEDPVKALNDGIRAKWDEPKFAKYRFDEKGEPAALPKLLDRIRVVAAKDDLPLTELARLMDRLLADQVTEGDPNESLLREFWGQPEMIELRTRASALRDSCKFGDPLYFVKSFGNGRVAVMTTTVGDPWSDWPSGLGAAGWVPVMEQMQKYLAGGGVDVNRSVGSPQTVFLENGRYKPTFNRNFIGIDTSKGDKASAPLVREDMKTQPMTVVEIDKPKPKEPEDKKDKKDATPAAPEKVKVLKLEFTEARKPGVYIYSLTWQRKDGDPQGTPADKPEYIAAVFNTDTPREGDLRRSSTDDLAAITKTTFGEKAERPVAIHAADETAWTDKLSQKATDLSSGRWIYLVILLVLIFEQAMAVRLSYHSRPEDLESYAPSAAAAFAGRTVAPTTDPDAEPAPQTNAS